MMALPNDSPARLLTISRVTILTIAGTIMPTTKLITWLIAKLAAAPIAASTRYDAHPTNGSIKQTSNCVTSSTIPIADAAAFVAMQVA